MANKNKIRIEIETISKRINELEKTQSEILQLAQNTDRAATEMRDASRAASEMDRQNQRLGDSTGRLTNRVKSAIAAYISFRTLRLGAEQINEFEGLDAAYVNALGVALGLTSDDIDDIFRAAALID